MSKTRFGEDFKRLDRTSINKCLNCGDPIVETTPGLWEHVFEEVECSKGAEPVTRMVAMVEEFTPKTTKERVALAYINKDVPKMLDALAEQAGINLNLRAEESGDGNSSTRGE